MFVKDKQYLANVIKKIGASVDAVNAQIIARREGRVSADDFLASITLTQLAIQQETLLVLTMLVADPSITADSLPEPPKKIIGFN
jgi:hypothetical protein